jgi:hypothetical protein
LRQSFSFLSLCFAKKACTRYRRTTGCDGGTVISACRPHGSWVLSFLRCVALPGFTMWYYIFHFMPAKLESVTPVVLGLKQRFFHCYGAEVNALVYFFIFALMRVFSTFASSPKNFMRRCPARRCAAKRACVRYRFTASHGNTPSPQKEYYHSRLPSDIAHSSARSWGAAPFMVHGSL